MNRTATATAVAAAALAALTATGTAAGATATASAGRASSTVGTPAPGAPLRFTPGATSGSVSGHLTEGGRESWTFRARAGQTAVVDLTSGDPSTRWTLTAPDGTPLRTQMGQAQDGSLTLPATGAYTLDVLTTGAADYTLDLALPVPVRFAPGATSATVHADLPAGATRELAFGARAGQSAQVALRHAEPGTRWTLVGPDGTPLHTAMTEVQDRVDVPLPADGTYLLTVLTGTADDVDLRLSIPVA
ncbi:hypothetical protein [Kineococcus sp. G2]|uniref:hypothetical protein n=1 Tax=Kineococcus sp. G2 TaxID=3127484 RepID=UPI00301C5905